jgi:predicted AAA+ superfamily ATPase
MFPLTIHELGDRFDFAKAVSEGMLPTLYDDEKNVTAKEYLDSYVDTYLREEVQAEGLTKNLVGFLKFLEVASFSHAEVVNYSNIAREAGISRKMVENYFSILEDLLIASFLPVFSKMAKRKLITHNKFYFFDAGVYQQLRPKGLLDRATNIYGAAVEGFVLQEMKAYNMYYKLDLQIYFWRSANDHEVDFVVYGQNKIIAIEVKGAKNIDRSDFKSLLEFKKDYEEAQLYYLYSGDRVETYGNINVVPIVDFLKNFQQIVS